MNDFEIVNNKLPAAISLDKRMKRYLVYYLAHFALGASAQTKDIDQIISQVFYNDEAYGKIFFEYVGEPGQDSFPKRPVLL